MAFQRKTRTSSTSGQGTTWAAIDTTGAFDIVIAAAAGDILELNASMLNSGNAFRWLDVAVMASGSPARWVSTTTSTHVNGITGWFSPSVAATQYGPVGGPFLFKVQSADIVSGNVTLRLYGKASTSPREIYGDAQYPITWDAVTRQTSSTPPPSGVSHIYAGSSAVAAVKVGTSVVSKIYQGTNLVYQAP